MTVSLGSGDCTRRFLLKGGGVMQPRICCRFHGQHKRDHTEGSLGHSRPPLKVQIAPPSNLIVAYNWTLAEIDKLMLL